jgi:DNA-binding response OmpR family regulator
VPQEAQSPAFNPQVQVRNCTFLRVQEGEMVRTEPVVVFYVDDNARSSRLLSSILRRCGFEVITSNDPIEALETCQQVNFDVALLDYEMPKMRGPELAQEIKFLLPDVPIVLISGRPSLPGSDLAFVDAHFGAGTDLDELIERLRTLVLSEYAPEKVSRSFIPWAEST